MRNYEEARTWLIQQGMDPDRITPEDIIAADWEPSDPLSQFEPTPNRPREEVKTDVQMLKEETDRFGWTPLAFKLLKRIGGYFAAGMLLLVLLCGCTGSQKAAEIQGKQSAETTILVNEYEELVEMFIEDWRQREWAESERVLKAALASHTRTVEVIEEKQVPWRVEEGVVKELKTVKEKKNEQIVDAGYLPVYEALKLLHIRKVENKIAQWRSKLAVMHRRAADIAIYNEALQAFYERKAANFEQLMKFTDESLDYFEQFYFNKKKSSGKPKAEVVGVP